MNFEDCLPFQDSSHNATSCVAITVQLLFVGCFFRTIEVIHIMSKFLEIVHSDLYPSALADILGRKFSVQSYALEHPVE